MHITAGQQTAGYWPHISTGKIFNVHGSNTHTNTSTHMVIYTEEVREREKQKKKSACDLLENVKSQGELVIEKEAGKTSQSSGSHVVKDSQQTKWLL